MAHPPRSGVERGVLWKLFTIVSEIGTFLSVAIARLRHMLYSRLYKKESVE